MIKVYQIHILQTGPGWSGSAEEQSVSHKHLSPWWKNHSYWCTWTSEHHQSQIVPWLAKTWNRDTNYQTDGQPLWKQLKRIFNIRWTRHRPHIWWSRPDWCFHKQGNFIVGMSPGVWHALQTCKLYYHGQPWVLMISVQHIAKPL